MIHYSETNWGAVEVTDTYISELKRYGIQCVRVPITWSGHIDDHYKVDGVNTYPIDPAYFDRIERVLDLIHAHDMVALISIHHDGAMHDDEWDVSPWIERSNWLKGRNLIDEERWPIALAKFTSIWTQIATRFADKGQWLLFNDTNEICLKFNDFFPDDPPDENGDTYEDHVKCKDRVYMLADTFVNIVRSIPGPNNQNLERILVYNPYGADTFVATEYPYVPEDPTPEKLIISVNSYYNLQNGRYIEWGARSDYEEVDTLFKKLKENYIDRNVGVHIGEAGGLFFPDIEGTSTYHAYLLGEDNLYVQLEDQPDGFYDDKPEFAGYKMMAHGTATWINYTRTNKSLEKNLTYFLLKAREIGASFSFWDTPNGLDLWDRTTGQLTDIGGALVPVVKKVHNRFEKPNDYLNKEKFVSLYVTSGADWYYSSDGGGSKDEPGYNANFSERANAIQNYLLANQIPYTEIIPEYFPILQGEEQEYRDQLIERAQNSLVDLGFSYVYESTNPQTILLDPERTTEEYVEGINLIVNRLNYLGKPIIAFRTRFRWDFTYAKNGNDAIKEKNLVGIHSLKNDLAFKQGYFTDASNAVIENPQAYFESISSLNWWNLTNEQAAASTNGQMTWHPVTTTDEEYVNDVLKYVQEGSLIELPANSGIAIRSLPLLISKLRSLGFKFRNVSGFLNAGTITTGRTFGEF
jgi:hypothetical protein